MKFLIVVASWNCMRYLPVCLSSIDSQSYKDYEVVVIDDASPEDTGQAEFIISHTKGLDNYSYMVNKKRSGALFSQVSAVRSKDLQDDDVIVFLDGDDRFAHNNVLDVLVEHYASGFDLTYGSYETNTGVETTNPAAPYDPRCIERNEYRKPQRWGIQFNHLRTIKHRLFCQLEDNIDFKDENGDWYTVAGDSAIMIPSLELAGRNHCFIEDVLVTYTVNSPHADWRKNAQKIDQVHHRIFYRTRRLSPLPGN